MTTRRSPVLDTAISSHSARPAHLRQVQGDLGAPRPWTPGRRSGHSRAGIGGGLAGQRHPRRRGTAVLRRRRDPHADAPADQHDAGRRSQRDLPAPAVPLLPGPAVEQFGDLPAPARRPRHRRLGALELLRPGGPPSVTARPARRRRPGIRPGGPRRPACPAPRAGPWSRRRRRCAWSCRHPPLGQDHTKCLERVVHARLDRADRDPESHGRLVDGAVAQDRLVQHLAISRREGLQRLATSTLRRSSSVVSAAGAFSSVPIPVSAGRALFRRLSSMTIRRATVASQGISDGSVRSSLPA